MLVGLNDSNMSDSFNPPSSRREPLHNTILNDSGPANVSSFMSYRRGGGGPVPFKPMRSKSRGDTRMDDLTERSNSRSSRRENPEQLEEAKLSAKNLSLLDSRVNESMFPSEQDYEPSVAGDEQKSRYEELIPFEYQSYIFNKIKENWQQVRADGSQYGNIVFLETGTGKTYIAIMLLKAIFMEDIELRNLSD